MIANNPHVFKLPKVEITRGRVDWIVERCKGKSVLHLGCVDEGFTKEKFEKETLMHTKLLRVCREVHGLDSSIHGLTFLKTMGVENLIQGDVERIEDIENIKGRYFDIILASEILEHLDNPGLFLQSVKRLFSTNTEMIITVPNCFGLTQLGYKLRGYEFVHPEHNYWFSYKTLLTLLSRNGYTVEEILVYSYSDYTLMPSLKKIIHKLKIRKTNAPSIEAQDNPKLTRKGSNPVTRLISLIKLAGAILLRRVLYSRNPFLADGIIVVVRI